MTDRRLLEIDYATPPANGDVPIYNSTTDIWEPAAGGGGGAVDSVNGQTGVVVLDTGDVASVVDSRYVTDADLTKLSNLSGTNTGDQTSIVGISGTMAEFNTAVTDGNILFNDAEGLGFRFENRTSDPGTPTVGQVWLRTDL
jgi:hypothetical protein